jgi:hypothetical protein
MIDEIHAHNFYKLDINCRAFSILKGGPKNLTGHVLLDGRGHGEVRRRKKTPPYGPNLSFFESHAGRLLSQNAAYIFRSIYRQFFVAFLHQLLHKIAV